MVVQAECGLGDDFTILASEGAAMGPSLVLRKRNGA
jgi:hypothetical protein